MYCYSFQHTDAKPKSSEDLKNASISQKGSSVTVECDRGSSCVLVYIMYGQRTLNCTYKFPFNVTLAPGNYTFAIFRRSDNNGIDERPFKTKFVRVEIDEASSSPPKLVNGK